MTYKSIRLTGLAATLLAATLPLHAAVPCEKAPTFKASDFLSASILKSSTYTISSTVPTSGLMGVFKLHTDFGDFECQGVEMLQIRLDELKALEQIQQVSRTKVFADAAKNTVLEPVQTAIKIVSNPVGTVVEIPKGVERLFGRVISGAEDIGSAIATTAKKVDEKPTPGPKGPDAPSSRQDPFGYNTARNVWAQRFGVDPYTSNAVLAAKLSVLARITFGTDAVAGWGVGAIARSANMLTTVDQLVLTETPEGVRAINAERLTQLGVSKESAIELLENRWFTPTLQTRFVKALASMDGVKNASSIVGLSQHIQSEGEARFLCRGVELLAYHHKKMGKLTSFRTLGKIPAAYDQNGSIIVSGPVDVIAWTKAIAEYAPQWEQKDVHPVLCTSGLVTRQAREGFGACGWSVHLIDIAAADTALTAK